MTAEVAILNQYGVALAADSAVTVQGKRVWQTSNKLFSVHPSLELGVMIYGSASYQGVPLETIIKNWRHGLESTKFDTSRSCAEDLVSFIQNFRGSQISQDFSASSHLANQIAWISSTAEKRASTRKELNAAILAIADSRVSNLQNNEELPNFMPWKEFNATYGKLFLELCNLNFKFQVYKHAATRLLNSCWEYARRKISSSELTGIVVAGFGRNESLPSAYQYSLDGLYGKYCRIWLADSVSVDLEQPSAIVSYAQSDVVESIIEGMNDKGTSLIKGIISGVLSNRTDTSINRIISDPNQRAVEKAIQKRENEIIVEEVMEGYANYRQTEIVNPVLEVVASLPKEEISVMAEALVDITSLVRKVGSPLQTVGGPVDVAVISKGDGFIWIKRKEYFKKEENIGYLTRADICVRRVASGDSQ